MKDMTERPLVWAIFAPLDATRLEEVAEDFRPPRTGLGARFQPQWEVKECVGDYSALFNRTPGTRDTQEGPMAKHLSLLLGQPVYVVYPDEDPEDAGVLVYEGGEFTRELPDNPYDFARGLGCPLPGEPEKIITSRVRGVAVVEGMPAARVSRILGYKKPPQEDDDDPRITDGPAGAVVAREDYGDLAMTGRRLSDALPGRDVYMLSTGPTPGRFLVIHLRNGKRAGVFDHNVAAAGSDPPPLNSVKGKREPLEIADALGVPHDLLDLEQFQ